MLTYIISNEIIGNVWSLKEKWILKIHNKCIDMHV